jgi:hypothetical protein
MNKHNDLNRESERIPCSLLQEASMLGGESISAKAEDTYPSFFYFATPNSFFSQAFTSSSGA